MEGYTTVGEIADWVGGSVHGDHRYKITGLAPLQSAGPEHLSFLANERYVQAFIDSKAGAILVNSKNSAAPCIQIACEAPYLAMAQVAQRLYPEPAYEGGISKQAVVHPSADIHPTAVVEGGAVISRAARIGKHTRVVGTAYVGEDAVIGADCILHAGSRVLHRCVLGDGVILQAGAVVGSDGFGYAPDDAGVRHKIPQVGIVVLEDNVELGANSTIDRATFGETRIGKGTKIDNLVQIAHNVITGEHCVVVSQSGVAGSTRLGDRVVLGAQSGIVGHIHIADDVVLAARAGVTSRIRKAGVYAGLPTMPHQKWLRVAASQSAVPDMRVRLRKLEAALKTTKTKKKKDPST